MQHDRHDLNLMSLFQLQYSPVVEKGGSVAGGAVLHLSPPRLAFIYSTFSIWPTFVYLQFFSSFLITLLITTTVFRSHCFADCRLSTVCVYLHPSKGRKRGFGECENVYIFRAIYFCEDVSCFA